VPMAWSTRNAQSVVFEVDGAPVTAGAGYPVNGTGNGSANILTGNNGANTLSGLAGAEMKMDAWGADIVVSASQKCLMCPPGLGFAAAAVGLLLGIPTLRLRGDYLAIATLGFGEIIRVVILNTDAVGGARGLGGIPTLAGFGGVYACAVLCVLSLWDWSDALRPDRDATSFGYVLGAGVTPGPTFFTRSRLGVELEHDMNQLVGHRFRALVTLDLTVLK